MAEGEVKVKITADSKEADRAVDGFESKVKGMAGNVAKVAAATAAAAAAAVTALAGMALDAYADYEQLVGGVETLYGESAQAVFDNAAQAFQTAGLSANDYMDQTVRMSGALIQSLGGDTEEAARIADMAIRDMSDNANKMGTDIGRIQDAYQGFSRGNFTMLDNLALGYGGTRSEMERLLEDAERIKASQGEMVDYSIDSYADMVEAINVVQTEMGITGTTAEEAAHTISGSIGMTKAAWENWLVALGDENADLQESTNQLVESFATAAENIGKRLAVIVPNILAALPAILSSIAAQVPPLFASVVGPMLDGVSQTINDAIGSHIDLSGGLAEMFSTLQETMAGPLEAIRYGFEQLSTALGPLVDTWLPILGNTFTNVVAPAIGYAVAIIVDLIGIAVMMATAIGEAITAVADWFSQLPETVGGVVDAVVGFVSGLVSAVVNFFTVTVPNAISTLIGWFAQLPGRVGAFLSSVLSTVVSWVAGMVSNAARAGRTFVSNVASAISALPGRVASFLSSVISRVVSFASQMGSNAASAARNFASRLISGIQSLPGRVASIGGQIVRGIANGITGAAGAVISALGGVVSSAISAAKRKLGIASPSKVFRDEVGKWIPEGIAEGIEENADAIQGAFDAAMDLSWAAPTLGAGLAPVAAGGGTVYNLYLDGDLLGVGGRIQSAMAQLVGAVETTYGMGRA